MEIISRAKGRTTKVATVTGTKDKDAALEFVMSEFGESKDTLWGWSVLEDGDGFIIVELFID